MPAPHPTRPDSGLTVQLGGPSHIAGSLWARNPPGAAEGHPATWHPLLCPQLGGSDPRWASSQDLLCCPNWVPAFALQCRADRPRAKDLPSLSRSPSPHHTHFNKKIKLTLPRPKEFVNNYLPEYNPILVMKQ